MKTAEDYFLPRDIMIAERADKSVKLYVDPYMSILSDYSDVDYEDEQCERVISLWGVEPKKNDQVHPIRALVLNDELYQYCMNHLSNTCETTTEDVTNQTIQ